MQCVYLSFSHFFFFGNTQRKNRHPRRIATNRIANNTRRDGEHLEMRWGKRIAKRTRATTRPRCAAQATGGAFGMSHVPEQHMRASLWRAEPSHAGTQEAAYTSCALVDRHILLTPYHIPNRHTTELLPLRKPATFPHSTALMTGSVSSLANEELRIDMRMLNDAGAPTLLGVNAVFPGFSQTPLSQHYFFFY